MLAGTHKILSLCLSLSLQVQLSHPPHPISFWADLTANHPSSEYSPPPPPPPPPRVSNRPHEQFTSCGSKSHAVTATDHIKNSHPVTAKNKPITMQQYVCDTYKMIHRTHSTSSFRYPRAPIHMEFCHHNCLCITGTCKQWGRSQHRANYLLKKQKTQNKLPTQKRALSH